MSRNYDNYDGYLAEDDSVNIALEEADDLLTRYREHECATFVLDEDAWAAGQ